MESKQSYTEGKKSDIESLRSIVEMVMAVDLMANNRKRCVVEARMIYADILRECNYSLNRIGMSLKKDHTTIMHYINKLKALLETDGEMLRKYYKCREIFMKDRQPETSQAKEELMNQIISLSNKLDIMIVDNERLKKENEQLKKEPKSDGKRLNRIVKFIDENTPIGHEFITERKIRKLFDE